MKWTVPGAIAMMLLSASCGQNDRGDSNLFSRITSRSTLPKDFGSYWYQGTAEITSYDLVQVRYGTTHTGTAVTIFVTEDLSREKQVKLDDPGANKRDAVKVLKLNATRKFNTGIYPYSTMTSVFTPVYRDRDPHTLKITTSIQEWCGQTFVQMNRTDTGYRLRHYSYFESEGDGDQNLQDVILEDELWNIIRLNPSELPTGDIRILPTMLHQRFSHSEWNADMANATLGPSQDSDDLMDYRLEYEHIGRRVLLRFRKDFPHQIEYWEEGQQSGSGPDAHELTTRATLKKRIMSDYWVRNRPQDAVLREQLAL